VDGNRPVTRRAVLAGSLLALAAGCATSHRRSDAPTGGGQGQVPPSVATPRPTVAAATTDPRTIAGRATVPVLCWHQLRDWRASDTTYDRHSLICPPAAFRAQLDALQSAGYTAISPDQYLAHLTTGAPLPARPVLLTFDDAQGSQITVGQPELQRRSMTATFFVMTVVLDKPNWMSRADVGRLAAAGHTIAAHTWDHHRADQYSGSDWSLQFDRPRQELESLLRKPVRHFAYPFGAWNAEDFPHLAAAGYRTAFQLSDKKMDPRQPLYTLRRTLVQSTWTGPQLLQQLHRT
jgi:peptidoglycan/xylan/chitin deacetylase (PgdA/CDA1 family)